MFGKIATALVLAATGIAVCAPAAGAVPSSAWAAMSTTGELLPDIARAGDAEVNATIAGTYTVYNATGQTLTLIGHHMLDGTWEGPEPINGTKVLPGHSYQFGVTMWLDRVNKGTVDFLVGDSGEHLRVTAVPQFGYGMMHSAFLDGKGTYAISVGGQWNSTLTLTTATPTVHDIPAGEGQAQYEALRQLCDSASVATCTFIPDSRVKTLAAAKRVSPMIHNKDEVNLPFIFEWNSVTTTTSEWGVEATLTANVANIVEASVAAHYNESIEHSEDVGGSIEIPVQPQHVAWVTYQPPIYRVTGDFTIKVGNESWNLTDVYFDVPRVDTKLGILTPEQAPFGDPRVPKGDDVF